MTALFCWCEVTWTLLSFTATVEQIAVGVAVSLTAALACAPLGPVAGPWRLLRPRRLGPLLALAASVAARAVAANLRLTRMIWSRRRPASAMVTVPTSARSDAEVTAVGLLTSIIVNSQLVDVDRDRHRLRYHTAEAGAGRDDINGPIEARVLGVTRR
ncbi:Na+/H+ antiporter subunit E [Dactylosporangium sp. CA-052675]|uniref:Na+/H+ antiporter subunit E n=1 Tax=Dactylosporangium sp. CA-052675 TaxID=3239927 RepID=UPI003D918860